MYLNLSEETINELKVLMNEIKEIFKNFIEKFRPLIDYIKENLYKDELYNNKQIFKPVLNISPNTNYIRNKKLRFYYSRGSR